VNFRKMGKPKFVALVGPTATGKSILALHLAQRFRGEIISADSVQVYRGLDIGTAKPSAEDRRMVRHHLVDICNPDEDYSAASFRQQADEIIGELHKGETPIFVVGGTGLYLKVLTRGLFRGPAADSELRLVLQQKAEREGSEVLHQELRKLDPEAASRIHPHDRFRIIRALEVCSLGRKPISLFQREHGFRDAPYDVLKIGLCCEREDLYKRIDLRVERMVELGWVDEVRSLLNQGYGPGLKSMQSIGYRHILSHVLGDLTLEEAVRLIKRDTRRYAKRQITWFKTDAEISWFPADHGSYKNIEGMVEVFLK
jgi:tRNA dimethylallyltransferase